MEFILAIRIMTKEFNSSTACRRKILGSIGLYWAQYKAVSVPMKGEAKDQERGSLFDSRAIG